MLAGFFNGRVKPDSSQPFAKPKAIDVDHLTQPQVVLDQFAVVMNQLNKFAKISVPVIIENDELKQAGSFKIQRYSILKEIFGCKTTSAVSFMNVTLSDFNKLVQTKKNYEDYKVRFENAEESVRKYISAESRQTKKLKEVIADYQNTCRNLDRLFDDLQNEIGRYILSILEAKDSFINLSLITPEQAQILNPETRDYLEEDYSQQRVEMGTVAFYALFMRAHPAVVAAKILPGQYPSICQDPASAVSEVSVHTFSRRYA